MDKIIEQLSQIDNEVKNSEVSFASEISKINEVSKDRLNLLKEIHKEASSVILDLQTKIIPLERQVDSLNAEIKDKVKTSDEITSKLKTKEEELRQSIESKTFTLKEVDQKLVESQEIVKSYLDEKEKINGALSGARVSLNLAEKNAKDANKEVIDAKAEVEKARKELGDMYGEKDILNADIRIKTTMIKELATAEREVIEKRLKELS